MVTNLIFFLYGMKVDYVRRKDKSFIFSFDNSFYIFKECLDLEERLVYLNNFIIYNNTFHTLVKNRYSRYLSSFDNSFYVLMRVKVKTNRLVLLEDFYRNKKALSTVAKNEFNWVRLWKEKIDQVETLINNKHISLYSLSIINYFINLSELAINYFNTHVSLLIIPITLCHKRINNNIDLYDYYSVTDIVFDHYTRDIAEYIKCDIYSDKEIDINKYSTLRNSDDKDLLISRILFPSCFFDLFDDYMVNKYEFNDFFVHFSKIDIYERNLFKIIEFLQK